MIYPNLTRMTGFDEHAAMQPKNNYKVFGPLEVDGVQVGHGWIFGFVRGVALAELRTKYPECKGYIMHTIIEAADDD